MRARVLMVACVLAAGCAETLPEHDNRIFTAVPVVRDLPEGTAAAASFLLVAGDGPRHVRAALHDDRAAAILPTLANGERVTLKCFCEGLTDHVQLKSCVVPS